MKYLSILLLLFFFACQNTCKKDEAKQLMGNWFLQKVTFPTDMELVNPTTVKDELRFDLDGALPKRTIVHYILADCDKCVHELMEIQKYLAENKDQYPDTKFIFIATGPIDIYVKEAAQSINFQYPIYFDKEYQSFKVKNKLPIGDKLYDNMLLDNKNRLLVFGAFYNNNKAENLYRGLLSCAID